MKAPRFSSLLAVLVLLAALALGGFVLGCSRGRSPGAAAGASATTLYTCGMHPQVIQDHPGNCPICGMKLTPLRRAAETAPDAASSHDSALIRIDPVTTQNMNLQTGVVTNGPLRRVIRTVGTIDYDETALVDVTTKFKGWIEKLFVDAVGKEVHRGEPLFEIYSPELYSAQVEYVLALGNRAGPADRDTASLRNTARLKLKYWDIPDQQIDELEKTRQPHKTLRVDAPGNGFVVEKMVVEGQMVEAGMRLYRLADLGLVWVQAQVYEQDLPFVRLGQEAVVTLSYLPDRKFRGRVTYLYPTVDEKTRTARVRMEFHNPGFFLKPGMYATVELESELAASALLIPNSAVLRSGERNTVFVALDGGQFEPRTVTLGLRAEHDQYEVLNGLRAGERVVLSGQFLLDSESQLREAIRKMRKPGASGGPLAETNLAEVSRGTPGAEREGTGSHVYVCPMPEHVSIEYEHPGQCPICGMALVPVSKGVLDKLPPGGRLLYYTCPMPEHSEVHEPRPGKCPKCGMTLIPVMEAPKLP